jgi:hypothetical protein
MSKKNLLPANRHHLMIYDEDWEFLQMVYGPGAPKPIGAGTAIKTMVHSYVERLRARSNKVIDQGMQGTEEQIDV